MSKVERLKEGVVDLSSLSETGRKDGRFRNVSFILYPDSANPYWQEYLEEECIPHMYIFHDKDIDGDGQQKEPHYHVILLFEGNKSPKQLAEICTFCGAKNGKVRFIHSIRGAARYLCHMDSPNKHQYFQSEVHCFAVDYESIISLPSDKYGVIGEMIDFVDKYNIVSFHILAKYAKDCKIDWYRSLCNNSTVFMKEYLKSKLWYYKEFGKLANPETGEVLDNIPSELYNVNEFVITQNKYFVQYRGVEIA